MNQGCICIHRLTNDECFFFFHVIDVDKEYLSAHTESFTIVLINPIYLCYLMS